MQYELCRPSDRENVAIYSFGKQNGRKVQSVEGLGMVICQVVVVQIKEEMHL